MYHDGTNVWIASNGTPTNNAEHYTQVALWENLSVEKIVFEEIEEIEE